MSSLVLFFVGVITALDSINAASNRLHSTRDLHEILDLIQKQRNDDTTDTDSSTETDISFNTINESSGTDMLKYEKLRRERIIGLLDKIASINELQKNDRGVKKKSKSRYIINRSQKRGNINRDTSKTQLLDRLLYEGINNEERKAKLRLDRPRKRLKPNRLLPNFPDPNSVQEREEDNLLNGLEDYSKVYIVLNPESIQRNNNNEDSLSELVSRVLALSSAPLKQGQNNQVNRNKRRYKAFQLTGDQLSRRSDSPENDYRARRPRGGGAPGHTAIPYLHPRGNIYERDDERRK